MINAKHEHLIQKHLLNIPAINKLLTEFSHCETCYVQQMIETGKQCPECIYYKGSKRSAKNNTFRTACKPSIFGPLGFLTDDHIGRTDVIYQFHHPELNWSMPILPEYDLLGNKTTKDSYFIKHHYKSHYNDRYVIRLINTEHGTIEAMGRRGDYTLVDILLKTRERHPSLDPGILTERPEIKEFYKSWENVNGLYRPKKDSMLPQIQEMWLRKAREKFPNL